jgi:arylsulfatase
MISSNVHSRFKLMAATAIVPFAIVQLAAVFLVLRSSAPYRKTGFSVAIPLAVTFSIALYFVHQFSYMNIVEPVWSNVSLHDEVRYGLISSSDEPFQFKLKSPVYRPERLIFAIMPLNQAKFLNPICGVDLEIKDDAGKILQQNSISLPLKDGWAEVEIPLEASGEKYASVEMRLTPFPKSWVKRVLQELTSHTYFPWLQPKGFRVAVTAPHVIGKKDKELPNVVLISIDTLRPDYVGAFSQNDDTPAIDSLANDGTVFTHALASATWTLPSHLSVMCSLYPDFHGMNDVENSVQTLPFLTLAESLQENGYQTAAFTEGGLVSARYGFASGFNKYIEYAGKDNENAAAVTFTRASKWIGAHQDERFFVFVHTYEAHDYVYPNRHQRIYADKNYNGIFARNEVLPILSKMRGVEPEVKVNSEDKAYLQDLYRGAVEVTDTELGKFLEFLRTTGVYDEALVVLMSDHGEAFGEVHDGGFVNWHHGGDPYMELSHVPLIIKLPAQSRIGRKVRINDTVSLLDIAPTVLEACNLPVPEQFQGTSLLNTIQSKPSAGTRNLFSVKYRSSVALYFGNMLYIHYRLARRNDELYDLERDPQQHENLVETGRGTEMLKTIEEHIQKASEYGNADYKKVRIDEEFQEHLKALGYL